MLLGAAALLVGAEAADLLRLLHAGAEAIRNPFGIDYGEGIVWQQMISIAHGRGYAPLGTFPAIVFHYPPVYHIVTAIAAELLGSDALATGRAISFAASLATALLIGLLAHALVRSLGRPAAGIAGILAGAMFLSCGPVVYWAALMRVDMVSGLFGMTGLLLAIRALDRPSLIHPASLCFTLAIFSKQVAIAAPAAAFLGLVTVRPRLAAILAAECIGLGLAATGVLEASTSGGFLRHIILYNMNRNVPARLGLLVGPLAQHGALVIAAIVGAMRAARSSAGGAQARAFRLTLLAFLALRTLLLGLIVKSGSAPNYMIEWFGAVAIFAALGVQPALALVAATLADDAAPVGGRQSRNAAAVLLLLAVQALLIPVPAEHRIGSRGIADVPALNALVRRIAVTPKPVVSDEMTLILRAGKPVLWEPSITAELGGVHRYDEAGFVRMLDAHAIGFFITEKDRGDPLFDSRYNPAVAAAIARNYPVLRTVAGLTLHLPRTDIAR